MTAADQLRVEFAAAEARCTAATEAYDLANDRHLRDVRMRQMARAQGYRDGIVRALAIVCGESATTENSTGERLL